MVSTTATTLASNRRKLRLAQHNRTTVTVGSKPAPVVSKRGTSVGRRGTSTSASAVTAASTKSSVAGRKGGNSASPIPSPTLTVGTTESSSNNSINCPSSPISNPAPTTVSATRSASLSPAARRRLLRHAAIGDNSAGGAHVNQNHQRTRSAAAAAAVGETSIGGGGHHQRTNSLRGVVTRPLHLQEATGAPVQQQQQQQPQSQPSASSTNNNNREAPTTSRGRSRRSRAATRRIGGGGGGGVSGNREPEISRVEQDGVLSPSTGGGGGGGNNNVNNNNSASAMSNGIRNGGTQRILDGHHGQNSNNASKLALNLHVAESVDSDDNGTCFNSIGTTTPRQPSPRHSVRSSHNQQQQPYQPLNEDLNRHTPEQPRLAPSKKNRRRRMLNAAETLSPLHEANSPLVSPQNNNAPNPPDGAQFDHDISKRNLHSRSSKKNPPVSTEFGTFGSETVSSRTSNTKKKNTTHGNSIWDHPEEMISANNPKYKPTAGGGGENSSNYSEFDHQEGSHRGGGGGGSVNNMHGGNSAVSRGGAGGTNLNQGNYNNQGKYNTKQQQRRGRATHRSTGNMPLMGTNGVASTESSKMAGGSGYPPEYQNGDPMVGRSVRQDGGKLPTVGSLSDENENPDDILNGPNMKAALGVGAAATLGAVMLGPVGLLVGAASVGIGMGIMQIPEEQRNNVRNHAATSLEKAREIACDLSDSMSSNCARYTGTDPHEVMGRVVPDEIMSCCYSGGGGEDGNNTFRGERGRGGHPHRGGVMEGY
eukprot:CAMPEP_0201915088 /NCGR_PEP_ID=MMETSP0903-20130614/5106_1 /ASSEMBLY_ACC=CAM_ASM_000552 /TAXON_ID=420261 /ORGANISM="Thalassiosira antarctica, Strain CCMP982" /LENGTH=761 /DNA_ID=CAMNT_0048450629 /DNA_START=112 /DNA_END=2394 /DNA_ORIENTATION=+